MIKTELDISKKALELAGEVSPYYNLFPLLELVKQAWLMGFDVVRPKEPIEFQSVLGQAAQANISPNLLQQNVTDNYGR